MPELEITVAISRSYPVAGSSRSLALLHFTFKLFLPVFDIDLQGLQVHHQIQRWQPSIDFFTSSHKCVRCNLYGKSLIYHITHSGLASLTKTLTDTEHLTSYVIIEPPNEMGPSHPLETYESGKMTSTIWRVSQFSPFLSFRFAWHLCLWTRTWETCKSGF